MKKLLVLLALVLSVTFVVTVVGCSNTTPTNSEQNTETEQNSFGTPSEDEEGTWISFY